MSIGTEDGTGQVELPTLYIVDHIPVENVDIVRQEINNWPHLGERGVETSWSDETISS